MNPIEMGQTHDVTVSKISKVAEYKADFERVFGPGSITIEKTRDGTGKLRTNGTERRFAV